MTEFLEIMQNCFTSPPSLFKQCCGDDVTAFDGAHVIFNYLYQIFINDIAWRDGGHGEGGAVLKSFS